MSAKLLEAVYRHGMSAPMKAVLSFLCWKANDFGGDCYPSIETISESTSLGKSTVQRAIKALDAEGWLRAVTGPCSKHYELNAARVMADPRVSERDRPRVSERDGVRAGRCQSDEPEGVRAEPEIQEKDQPPSSAREKRSRKGPLPDDWTPEPFSEGTKSAKVVAGWSEDKWQIEIEKFRAWHGARDTRYSSWQQAWVTWVLRTYHGNGDRHGGSNRNGNGPSGGNGRGRGDGFDRAIDRSLGLDQPPGPSGRGDAGARGGDSEGPGTHLRLVFP